MKCQDAREKKIFTTQNEFHLDAARIDLSLCSSWHILAFNRYKFSLLRQVKLSEGECNLKCLETSCAKVYVNTRIIFRPFIEKK